MAAQRPSRPAVRTSYRRDRTKEQEQDTEHTQNTTKATAPAQPLTPALVNLYGTSVRLPLYFSTVSAHNLHLQGDLNPPVLVVDGYNFLHQWKELAQADGVGGISTATHSMHDAREVVVKALEVYSQCRGVRVVVVFDAMHSPQGGSR